MPLQLKIRKRGSFVSWKTHKPYLNPELTLPELAKMVDMKTKDLSYFLNQYFKESFYAFINRYRVEESKRLLIDSDYHHLNMLGIAHEAGFNSKRHLIPTLRN